MFTLTLAASNNKSQATYSEGEYCLSELSEEVQKRGEESNTGVYQTLELETMDSCSMYSKIHRQQTPTVERGNHMYAVIDSTRIDQPSHYAKLKTY